MLLASPAPPRQPPDQQGRTWTGRVGASGWQRACPGQGASWHPSSRSRLWEYWLRGQGRTDRGLDVLVAVEVAVLDHQLGIHLVDQWDAVVIEPGHHSGEDQLTGIRSDKSGSMAKQPDELRGDGRADLGPGAVVEDGGLEREGAGIA